MNAHFYAKVLLADHKGPTFNVLRLRTVENANGTESDAMLAISVPLSELVAADLKIMSKGEAARALYELAKIGCGLEGNEIVDLHPEREVAPSNVIRVDFVARAAKRLAVRRLEIEAAVARWSIALSPSQRARAVALVVAGATATSSAYEIEQAARIAANTIDDADCFIAQPEEVSPFEAEARAAKEQGRKLAKTPHPMTAQRRAVSQGQSNAMRSRR